MRYDEDGLRVALSPVQLAAVIQGESLSPQEIALNRVWGGVRVIGGVIELMGAGVLCAAPEPTMTTKIGCVVVGAHGADTTVAGYRQLVSGRNEQDYTEKVLESAAMRAGASKSAASTIALTVDAAVSIAATLFAGAIRVSAVSRGRISLAAHEAAREGGIGGHTLARHVGLGEAQLRARLAKDIGLQEVSSFRDLVTAERSISQVLKREATAIEKWSRDPAAPMRLRLKMDMGREIGYGVSRATGKMAAKRGVMVVLKREVYNDMTYYVLTAFPF